jgi:2-hydroxyacyl-CoA lyase 1
MPSNTGAQLIARALHELGIKVIFGLVGIPVIQIAEEAIALGIRFIAFRNEQACSYAATAYGYLTGRPGVCLVVGGPGVLHAMAGIGNSSANAFPMLLLAGSSETHLVTKGAFQELDALTLLAPHTKIAIRTTLDSVPQSITNAYRTSWYGRGGTGFVDIPADVIQGEDGEETSTQVVPIPPRAACDPERVQLIARLLKSAKAPLVIVGKGAAYARAESAIRRLVNQTKMSFLPTPMGKGVLPDSHPSNTASARSTALKDADVVLILGARLNWILHFGEAPKWNPAVKIIQVDISAEELGKNNGDPALAVVGDINVFTSQLIAALQGWQYDTSSAYIKALKASTQKNEVNAAKAAKINTIPMKYGRTFDVIKETLNRLSPPEDGRIVYVSEGANTMDISRSVFPVEHPRMRLDAGTYATMGVGLGYAIAAHCAYNLPDAEGQSGPSTAHKKIVCLEGDSAFGFSMAEVETMARYNMDVLIFVVNNGGVYHGDSADSDAWLKLQQNSLEGVKGGLRSTSLGWEVSYEKMAEMCGGKGYLVRTPEELSRATEEGFKATVPVVVNIIIEAGQAKKVVSASATHLVPDQFCVRSN